VKTIQAIKDLALPNGIRVRQGAVLTVPEDVASKLIGDGLARPHERPGPTEIKDMLPPPPATVPYTRMPTPPADVRAFEPGAYEDQDNIVRNLVTVIGGWPYSWSDQPPQDPPPLTPPPSIAGSDRDPVLTLEEIKLHCKIEFDQTVEDSELMLLERAAHIHTENYLRYQIGSTVGENVKTAILMLIGHWYRNRETVTTGRTMTGVAVPFGYLELLGLERDYPIY